MRITRCALLGLAVLALQGCASKPSPSEAVHYSRNLLKAYAELTGVPALQVAVAIDGKLVWSEAFGLAQLSPPREATPTSRFRIASISKLLTGTLTAKLAREGILDLDLPLGAYVDDIPEAWEPITARMLVHHTSGIPHYRDREDALDSTFYATTRAAIAKFKDRPLVHAPGQGETYSSYAYTVLALAIEAATHKPFLDVMQQEILDPLHMIHTGPDLQGSPPPERTAFYTYAEDGTVHTAPYLDLSGRWAGSGYLSTAEDLALFGAAHTPSGMFGDSVLALVSERVQLPDGSWSKEGFAWGPRTDWDGRTFIWGDGSTPGCRGGLMVYPQEGLSLCLLTNARGFGFDRGELQTVARLFLAEMEGGEIGPVPDSLNGAWTGTLTSEGADLKIKLTLGETARPDSLWIPGWRSFELRGAFRAGDTNWVVPMDRQGFFPLTLKATGDSLDVGAPRADLSLRMGRPGE